MLLAGRRSSLRNKTRASEHMRHQPRQRCREDDRVLVGQACADVWRVGGGKSAVAALVTKLRATSVSRWLLLRA